MMRVPVIPTIIVAAAIAAMIALGIWQLDRAAEKRALLSVYTANLSKPAMHYPELAPVPPDALFRRSSANCLQVVNWRTEAGRSIMGQSGYRFLAECRTGAEGPGLIADMGVGRDPTFRPLWKGGVVSGRITTEPQHGSLIGQFFEKTAPARPMLVSDAAAPGLDPSEQPSVDNVPNNHIGYAGQWFFFALVAAIIYFLALRRRDRADQER